MPAAGARKIALTPPTQPLTILIGGIDRTLNVLKTTLMLQFVLTSQQDVARMTVAGFDPVVGQTILAFDGRLLFAGIVQRVIQHSIKVQSYKLYDIECVDWTWLLNRRRVTKTYAAGQSASVIFSDVIATSTS